MEIITPAKDEEEILLAVSPDADAKEIYQGLISRAECCVVHLCGCK